MINNYKRGVKREESGDNKERKIIAKKKTKE